MKEKGITTKEKGVYDLTLRLERESSPEEKRHEVLRIMFTYALLNLVSVVLIHLLISPIIAPHEFSQAVYSKGGMAGFKIFCGVWTIITAFYNCMLGVHGVRWFFKKWEKEEAESHWNRYRDPKGEGEESVEDGDDDDDKTEEWDPNGPGSKVWFANNNPYTAARRTHSGNFAAARRNKRPSHPIDNYYLHTEHEPILEENDDGDAVEAGGEATIRWKERREDRRVSFPNLKSDGDGSVSRHAEAYPFPKDELDTAPSSTTTWSNSATSAGEFARKRKKGKKKGKWKKRDEKPKEGLVCSSPTCGKAKYGDGSSGSSSWGTCARCSSTSTPSWERDKYPKTRRVMNPDPQSSSQSGEVSSKQQSEDSKDQDVVGDDYDGEDKAGRRRPNQQAGSGASSEMEDSEYEPVLEQTRIVKDIITHGSYYDQQAAIQHMNSAIWSEVGSHMERQLRIQEPPPQAGNSREEQTKTPWWWNFRRRRLPRPPPPPDIEMVESKASEPPSLPTPNVHKVKETRRRRQLIALILIACGIMTLLPPLMAIGGDIIAHDYQFHHACDQVRWDIKLDASGLHPEQDNIYNRAIFKDRRGKGYEKEFMMNLEGMSTYGSGLDLSLVNQRRGYVFYLSKKDLANQPDGGESVKFPYPVVVAYDMLKHAYYAHDDIWKDLKDESFFDNGAFMNGTLGIFPSESIWLEKKEKDGFCGQPKRVLKNGADKRIIWTVIDDRKDCTVLRVCASNKATRRQVVIATGMILLRLALSATCCSGKGTGDSAPVGT
ncbi:hypothetical protein TWF730_000987 [Orbilia blumenaviensis]|uniref:Uncharacterized protein n=1 Tax=Orbilia blumenaviensis TaxID=1796055 RepID=A0AAV9VPH0_9PEZI